MTLLILVGVLQVVFLTMTMMSPNKAEAKCYGRVVHLTTVVTVLYGILRWLDVPA